MNKVLQQQLRRFYKTHQPCKEINKYIGCTRDYFKAYIDSKLLDNMNFINIGKEWEFDHIVPTDLFTEDEYDLCWNYQNIFPMLSKDNKRKGASVHFSLELLLTMPETEIRNKLIKKCKEQVKELDKYLKVNKLVYCDHTF